MFSSQQSEREGHLLGARYHLNCAFQAPFRAAAGPGLPDRKATVACADDLVRMREGLLRADANPRATSKSRLFSGLREGQRTLAQKVSLANLAVKSWHKTKENCFEQISASKMDDKAMSRTAGDQFYTWPSAVSCQVESF